MTKRELRWALIGAALTLPHAAGHAENAAETGVFAAEFAPYAALPAARAAVPGAVDIAAIAPPVEVEPEPEPEADGTDLGTGVASYYGAQFHGRRTASGERFDMHGLTAAHRTLPFGTRVEVTNPRTGKSVVVRINDRGPFHHSRAIDLSRAAAERIGIVARGHGTVRLSRLD